MQQHVGPYAPAATGVGGLTEGKIGLRQQLGDLQEQGIVPPEEFTKEMAKILGLQGAYPHDFPRPGLPAHARHTFCSGFQLEARCLWRCVLSCIAANGRCFYPSSHGDAQVRGRHLSALLQARERKRGETWTLRQ